MGARIILTFSGQPAIDDSVTLNSQFLEIFKSSRNGQGQTAIGADVSETITNFETAIIEDYSSVFDFTTETTQTTITINFSNANNTFFDVDINSSVIKFEIIEGYFTYFTSIYDNKVDDFELLIQGTDPTFELENINAVGILQYKDVDNILEPIRGAQLDIEIDANIEKPFELFLDFREKDFKVIFYRNGNKLFEGFVNPEGVQQDYTSINWRAKLVAVDNLGALKNKEHPYGGQTPTEYVFLDLALQETGLDLPIAFFDDINKKVRINNVVQDYGATIDKGFNERLIEPSIYKNDNDKFLNCEEIVKDILNKYNAVLVQQSITTYNVDTQENESILCWLFCRVSLLSLSNLLNENSEYGLTRTVFYAEGKPFIFVYPDNKFTNPTYKLGTDGQSNLDVIHKNKNQLIRQTRALRAFRFTQKWVNKPSILGEIGYNSFEVVNQNNYDDFLFNFTPLSQAQFIGLGTIQNVNFDPTSPIENQSNSNNSMAKLPTISLPDDANTYKISGSGSLFKTILNDFTVFSNLMVQILYTDTNGNRYYLQQPPETDGSYLLNQFFVKEKSTFNQAQWVLDSEITQDALGNLQLLNVSNPLFYFFGNKETLINFDLTFPAAPSDGGEIDIYISPLIVKDKLLGILSTAISSGYRFALTDFKFEIISPADKGIGNYYDAVNAQDVSSKVGDPVKIINADDQSDIYLNGLKRRDTFTQEELESYPYWTSKFNLNPNRVDILELMAIERIRLLSKSQNIFSGDIHGYIPYFTKIINTAYDSNTSFVFTKWAYDTVNNTIQAEMMECNMKTPSVNYEKSVIFEDEDKKLIEQ